MHERLTVFCYYSVVDSDLEIRGGPGHPHSEIRKGGSLLKKISQPFGPQFGLKIRRGGQAPVAPPLDPPLLFSVL